MTYRIRDKKYTFYKRNGKDCYIWFELRDYYNETIFKSSVHKVSLNVYRFVGIKYYLRGYHLYI